MPPIPPAPIKLAILDDYQCIGAQHFEPLKPAFEITVFRDTLLPYNHPSTPDDVKRQLVERLKPFKVLAIMRERTPLPAELMKQLPNLKLILSNGHRNNSLDLPAAKALGIVITATTGEGRTDKPSPKQRKRKGPDSTTQHAVALILGIARCLAADDKNVKSGLWQTDLTTGLSGKTYATMGLGRLGGSVAKIMYQSFGMRIIAWSNSLTQEAADQKAQDLGLPTEDEGGKIFEVVGKEELFEQADVLSVHYVLSPRSVGIVGAADLALLKPSALFINTSRGPLVTESALLECLEQGRIRGAAIDVYDVEPLPLDSKWRTVKWGEDGRSNVLLSPHMGYVEEETMGNWYEEQVEIAQRWYEGKDLIKVLNP